MGQEGITAGMYFTQPTTNAPAANVLLIETYGYRDSRGGKNIRRAKELKAFARAVVNVLPRKR